MIPVTLEGVKMKLHKNPNRKFIVGVTMEGEFKMGIVKI
jgi:hypothetical protein